MDGSRWLSMREWENMSKMISKLCPGRSTLIVTNGVVYSTISYSPYYIGSPYLDSDSVLL